MDINPDKISFTLGKEDHERLKTLFEKPLLASTEIEVRIKFSDSSKKFYYEDRLRYFTQNYRSHMKETSDTVYVKNSKDTKNVAYRAIQKPDGSITFEKKEKQAQTDMEFIIKYGEYVRDSSAVLRFSRAEETKTEKFDHNIGTWIRNRKRTSFDFKTIKYEFTHTTGSGNEDFEVEIEYNMKLIAPEAATSLDFLKAFGKQFKISIAGMFPNLHTLYLVDDYKNLYKPPVLTRAKPRPKNLKFENLESLKRDNYFVTNKLDGTAYYLREILGLKPGELAYILVNSTDLILLGKRQSTQKILHTDYLEVEYTEEDSKIAVFDTSEQILFEEKLNGLKKHSTIERFQELLSKTRYSITVKNFINTGNIRNDITQTVKWMFEQYGEDLVELNDGIIFQPNVYWLSSNKQSSVLKWKFPSKISIDFLAVHNNSDPRGVYVLHSKTSETTTEAFKIGGNPVKLVLPERGKSDGMDNAFLHNKIVEVIWDSIKKRFKILRIRRDKTSSGANFINVANDTYFDMINKFTLPNLLYYLQLNTKQLNTLSCLINYTTCLTKISYDMLSEVPINNSILFLYPEVPLDQEYLDSRDTLVISKSSKNQKITKKYDYIVLFGTFNTIELNKIVQVIQKLLAQNGKVIGWFMSGDEIQQLKRSKPRDTVVYKDFCYELECKQHSYLLKVINKAVSQTTEYGYAYGLDIIKSFSSVGLNISNYSRVYGNDLELSYSAFSLQSMLRTVVFTTTESVSSIIPQYLGRGDYYRYSHDQMQGYKLIDFIKPELLQRIINNFSVSDYLKIPSLIKEDTIPYHKLLKDQDGNVNSDKLDEFISDKLDKFVQKHKLSTISTKPAWINMFLANVLKIETVDPYMVLSLQHIAQPKGCIVMFPDGEVQFIKEFKSDIEYLMFIEKAIVNKYKNFINKNESNAQLKLTIGKLQNDIYAITGDTASDKQHQDRKPAK